MTSDSRKRSGLITVFLALLAVALVACGSSATPVGTPEVTVPEGWDPMGTVVDEHRSSGLLEILGKLPLSFKEQGVWFADYFRARELAGAPQPGTLAELLALSDDERQAYQAANLGLLLGPGLFASIRDNVREWE